MSLLPAQFATAFLLTFQDNAKNANAFFVAVIMKS